MKNLRDLKDLTIHCYRQIRPVLDLSCCGSGKVGEISTKLFCSVTLEWRVIQNQGLKKHQKSISGNSRRDPAAKHGHAMRDSIF
jgi:hypothetical protein